MRIILKNTETTQLFISSFSDYRSSSYLLRNKLS
jgi:hypothetical protein